MRVGNGTASLLVPLVGNLATVVTKSYICDGDLLPGAIGPVENVVGKVVLDTAAPSGVVVYKPWYGGGGTGWKWVS
jgi:hypothetical protein